MAYTVQSSAAALNRAFNNANATPTAFAATVADLTAGTQAAANNFDVATLTDLALSTQVLTNMGILPSTNTAVIALEAALADYFAGPGKGNRGFVVLQLAEILSGFAATDVNYGAAATAWNAEVAASVAAVTGTTIALTTSTTDVATGGAGDDLFTALVSALSTTKTLNATDKIVGDTGTDTLKADVDTTWAGFTTGSATGIEKLELTNTSGSAQTFSAAGITGLTDVTVNAASGAVTVSNLPTGVVNYNLNGQKSGTFTASFASGATSDDSVINLDTVGATTTVTLAVADVAVATINSTGTNKVTLGGSLEEVTVTGSGNITVSDVASTTTLFDASAATGNVVVTTTGAATATTTVGISAVKTGSGTDSITASVQDMFANATLSGGVGNDTLNLSSTAAKAVQYKMTGIETLNLGNTSGTLTFSGLKSTDIATIKLTAPGTSTSGTASAIDFVEMGAANLAFTANGASSDSANISSDHTGTTTINYTATGTAALAGTGADAADADFVVDSATGALTVAVGAYIGSAGTDMTVSAAKASSVTLTTASGKGPDGTQLSVYDGTITAVKATSISVDAQGQLSGATISATKATTATITAGSSASNSMTLTTAALTTLDSTSSGVMNYTGSTLTALQNVTVNAKAGLTTLPALDDAASIKLSGTGTTSAVTLGTLGTTSADHDLTLTASGLKADLAVGLISYTAGNAVSIDLTGLTGDANFGDIGTSAAKLGDVTVTADSVSRTLDLDAIYSTGTVNITATNTGLASTIDGTVYGTNVTVDVRGSGTGSTIPTTVYADTTVSLSAHELSDATTYTVHGQASSTKTALSVTLNGGLNAETLNIYGKASQTAITVAGDLGAGADTVLVDSTISSAAQTISLESLTNYTSATVWGGSGADTIKGGAGADTIYGGSGADKLTVRLHTWLLMKSQT